VSRNLLDSLDGGVSLFYNELTDRITYVRSSDGTGRYENFGKVNYKGAELTFGWKPSAWLKATSSYIYLIAKDEETDLWITASPKHRLQANIQYMPLKGLTFTLIPQYVCKQFTRSDNKEYAKPYCILECRIDYSFKSWRLFTRIENITDKTYLYGDGLPAPPREWLVGASFEF
jgi:outer membrane cobalamin receptor